MYAVCGATFFFGYTVMWVCVCIGGSLMGILRTEISLRWIVVMSVLLSAADLVSQRKDFFLIEFSTFSREQGRSLTNKRS